MSAEEERDRIRTNVMAAANDGDIAALINAMSVLSHLEPCCKFDFIVDPMFQDTPLMITANNGHLECLRLLLNSNARYICECVCVCITMRL